MSLALVYVLAGQIDKRLGTSISLPEVITATTREGYAMHDVVRCLTSKGGSF
jgi:hypothetical protein